MEGFFLSYPLLIIWEKKSYKKKTPMIFNRIINPIENELELNVPTKNPKDNLSHF